MSSMVSLEHALNIMDAQGDDWKKYQVHIGVASPRLGRGQAHRPGLLGGVMKRRKGDRPNIVRMALDQRSYLDELLADNRYRRTTIHQYIMSMNPPDDAVDCKVCGGRKP